LDRKPASVILLQREGFRMVDYETITGLVDQIPADTWEVLRENKERRPAMMLSELIDFRIRALQQHSAQTLSKERLSEKKASERPRHP
jgi:hypothetical protein